MQFTPHKRMTSDMRLQPTLDQLSSWFNKWNLAFNSKKTKAALFSKKQLALVQLDDYHINLSIDGKVIENATHTRLLETEV